ncbi:putative membrane protein [Thermodesulfovibrio sp. N1]|nr:putative membrane protein [Thermodesulfovibrio sp. N1]
MKQQAESPVIIPFSIIAFIILFLFYLFSLNPILPTGDAGGLITASYLLGTAHPPGYPLYSELGKLFTFLPFGNIGYRVSLLPCFFSVLTLFLVYLIVRKLTEKNSIFPIIAVLFLGVSYSFYFQTIIGKFYPINALIVLLLVFIGIKVIDSGFEKRYAYLSSFLLGVSTGLHHTALFMTIPLFILGLFYFKAFVRSLPLSLLFFFIGFSVNLHVYIRNLKDAFLAVRKAGETPSFLDILLRKFYKEGESLQAVTTTLSTFEGFHNAIKNFLYMIDANFGYVTAVFFILGLFYLYRKSRRVLLFLFVSFLMFSLVLAKITFSGEIRDNEGSLYIVGNQYFIPAFCLYVIFYDSGDILFCRKNKKNETFL